MKILAVEFASPQRSVALADTDANTRCRFASSEVIETGARSTHAFKMIEEALGQARVEREQVDCLAIGLGPGSYTGIRAAIALAQGWQLAREIKTTGASSVAAMAVQAQEERIYGRVSIIVNAQREEFYLATWEITEAARNEIEPLKILPLAEIQSRAAKREILIGPEAAKISGGRTIFPYAKAIARLATAPEICVPGEKLEPIYLRETNFVKAPKPVAAR